MAGEPNAIGVDAASERSGHRHWFDRLTMLSDGVFAIAITLLALDIHAPETVNGDLGALWSALAPQLDSYALSFVVISIYWLAHRRFMAMILAIDAPVTVLNLVTLGLVALLPAATRLTHSPGPLGPYMIVYSALIVLIGFSLGALWGYAALIANLASPSVSRPVRWFTFALVLITPPLFLLLTAGLPQSLPGAVPLCLTVLFLIGWRLRLRSLRWLARWDDSTKRNNLTPGD